MGLDPESLTGGCMCGAVRYAVAGAPSRVLNCHCRSCRTHTGAAMATLAVLKADQVDFSGDERKVYDSAPGVGRAFCANCGTSLTWETVLGDEGPIVAVHISTFDDPNALPPSAHTFYPERLSWFDAADDLPRYEGFMKDGALLRRSPAKERPSGQ
jgi:hypothetical protein